MTQQVIYGRRHPLRQAISKTLYSLTSPQLLYENLTRTVKPNPLGCMMCVYDEQATIIDALQTTMNIVDYYVIVDKNGATIDTIKESGLNIDAEYHVKPELTLVESREYALSRINNAEWILIQDGDEFYMSELKHLPRTRPHILYRTRKNIIYPDRTMPLYQSGYHGFLYHNNGTIWIPYPNDIPHMKGRTIHLEKVLIWNYHHKRRPKPQTIHYNSDMGSLPVSLEALM